MFFVTFQTKYKRRFEDIYCSSQSVVFYICLLAGVTLILSIHSMYKVLLTIHGLDKVSVQFMTQLVNDAGDSRPTAVKRIRGNKLIDLPL